VSVVQRHDCLIAVCIPTHDGRRETLAALLEGIVEQARDLPGLVEICVSDNASRDGTAELLVELEQSASCPVTYRRHTTDQGMARNLLAAVELARAKYCWLLGSDDLLASGALHRAVELLREIPEATGYVVGAIHVDAEEPALRSRSLSRAFHPPGEQTRSIDDLDQIYDHCGNAWCALSWSIVDREAWLGASRRHREMVLAHPVFPQIVILAEVARERSYWGVSAESLVRQRNATTFLFEQDDVPLADRWAEIVGGATATWAAVLGGYGKSRWRRRMRLLHKVWGSAADVRATKLYENPTLPSQARLALTYLRAFWPVGDYWREVLPATLAPIWLTRARYGLSKGSSLDGPRGEPPKLMLSAELPCRMVAGTVHRVIVEARNDGPRTISSDGPRAVTIGQRWSTTEGHTLGRVQLGLNELAAMPQSLPRAVRVRRTIRGEITLYAPVEPGSYRVEVGAYQHGRGWLADLAVSRTVAKDVEVIAPECLT
jgi:glycosyltransferase involved in cell wall biosynthesis